MKKGLTVSKSERESREINKERDKDRSRDGLRFKREKQRGEER